MCYLCSYIQVGIRHLFLVHFHQILSTLYTAVIGLLLKIKIHSSCEVEDFVETHLCELCVILRSRVLLGVVSSLRTQVGDSPWNYSECSLYQGQQGDVNQSVRRNYKTRFRGDKNLTAVEGNASVYHVYPVPRITGEGRAAFLRGGGGGAGG